MEVVVRVGLVGARVRGGLDGVKVGVGGFVKLDRLCLEASGALLTPSETEARGRAAEVTDPLEPAGDITEARVVAGGVVVVAGLVLVDDDKDFVGTGAVGFRGTVDILRVGGATFGAGPLEEAMAGFEEIAEEELMDGLRTGAVGLAVAEGVVVAVGLLDTALMEPAPNVPELIIYSITLATASYEHVEYLLS